MTPYTDSQMSISIFVALHIIWAATMLSTAVSAAIYKPAGKDKTYWENFKHEFYDRDFSKVLDTLLTVLWLLIIVVFLGACVAQLIFTEN